MKKPEKVDRNTKGKTDKPKRPMKINQFRFFDKPIRLFRKLTYLVFYKTILI